MKQQTGQNKRFFRYLFFGYPVVFSPTFIPKLVLLLKYQAQSVSFQSTTSNQIVTSPPPPLQKCSDVFRYFNVSCTCRIHAQCRELQCSQSYNSGRGTVILKNVLHNKVDLFKQVGCKSGYLDKSGWISSMTS